MMAPLLSVAHVRGHGRRTGCPRRRGVAGPLERRQLPLQRLGIVMGHAVVLENGHDHGATRDLKAVTTPSGTRAPFSLRPIATWFGPSGTSPAPSAPFSFGRPAGLPTAPAFPQTDEARVATICSALEPAEWSSGSMKISSSPQAPSLQFSARRRSRTRARGRGRGGPGCGPLSRSLGRRARASRTPP